MSATPAKLPPIPNPTTLDEVVDAIQSIIDWSIGASSRLGYFAALYKRITIAVRTAVADGAFENGARMERFDVAFANRYFEALNGYFHPHEFATPTYSWQVTFDSATRPGPIIVQHMIGGVNAHIDLDLGIAAQTIDPGLSSLHGDFNTINAVLASQVNGVVAEINELSPALADIYAVLMKNEINLINEGVKQLRDSAWRFAQVLDAEPELLHSPTIWARDIKVAAQGAVVYNPPPPIAVAVSAIAAREGGDIAKNIRALDVIASAPAPIMTTL